MEAFNMAVTDRHTELSYAMAREFLVRYEKELLEKKVRFMGENSALVYYGVYKESLPSELVNIKEVTDVEEFTRYTINDLEYVQPDITIFTTNSYLLNEQRTKTAGYPNLVVEIWSRSNHPRLRNMKIELYSTSPVTEHWYIEQNSNAVERYFGKEKLIDLCLTKPLETKCGIVFDLTKLAWRDL